MDRQGNVFYTDLVHVWRIAADGSKSVAVRDVHTHELAIDSLGNLFGEDSEYLGGDRWRHRVWRRSPDGRVTALTPWRDGVWPEYGFVRDHTGAMYWVQCPDKQCVIRKRTPNGRTSTFAPGVRFNHPINWFAAGPGGSLYVVEGPDLRRVSHDGRVTLVARNLGPHVMGLWPENARHSLLAAVYGRREIVRITSDGRVSTMARSTAPWAPSGVTVAPNGDLWILEYSTANQARVRRVTRRGQSATF
jgi:hypothetical protein